MKLLRTILGMAVVAGTCGLGFGGLSGCGEMDETGPGSDVTQTEGEIRRHHRRPGMGHHGTGGAPGTGGGRIVDNDCGVCDRAANCCNAATSGPLCNVSSTTCNSMSSAAARDAYINNCLVVINAIAGTRTSAPETIPAACK